MKQNYLKTESIQFLNSFKLKFNYLQIALFDLIFFAISVPTSMIFMYIMKSQTASINPSYATLTQEAVTKMSETELATLYSSVKSIAIWIAASMIVAALLIFFSWCFTRGIIYTKILGKQFNRHYFKKFCGLNIFLAALSLLLLLLSSVLLKSRINPLMIAAYVLLILLIYFTTMIYIEFTKSNLVFASIGEGLSKGFRKSIKLLLPGIAVLAVGIIIGKIAASFPENIFITVIVFVIYAAWARLYFIPAAERN